MKVLIFEDPQVARVFCDHMLRYANEHHVSFDILIAEDETEARKYLPQVEMAIVDIDNGRHKLVNETCGQIPIIATTTVPTAEGASYDNSILRWITKPNIDWAKIDQALMDFTDVSKPHSEQHGQHWLAITELPAALTRLLSSGNAYLN